MLLSVFCAARLVVLHVFNLILTLILSLILVCVTLHLRIANRLVTTDSRCRGGIVHIRGVCSCAHLERRSRPKALWRFRASTSNSLSDRSSAAYRHAFSSYSSYSRSTRYSSMWRLPLSAAIEAVSESQGALAVSCKYFKQSKWPFLAATNTHIRQIDHTYAQQDIRVCGDDHFQPPKRQYKIPKAL